MLSWWQVFFLTIYVIASYAVGVFFVRRLVECIEHDARDASERAFIGMIWLMSPLYMPVVGMGLLLSVVGFFVVGKGKENGK